MEYKLSKFNNFLKNENKMKNFYLKFLSTFTVVALLLFVVGPQLIYAAGLTAISDTMSREKASTASTHVIKFTSTSAIGTGNTIAIAFPSGFTTTSLAITELQICHGTNGTEFGTPVVAGGTACGAQPETISTTAGNNVWGVVISGTTTITFTAPSTFTNTISAGQKVTITIVATHMINPTASTPSVTITTTSDTGSFSVPIIADDSVPVTATVNQTVTFSLNVALTNTGGVQAVALGTLTTAAASGSSDAGGTIYPIWTNIGTNASGGAVVTVVSANGALKSTAVSGDTIPSATATMTAGTANYGICIKSVSQTSGATLTKGANFNGATCTNTANGNTVGAVTTSAQSLLTAATPINAGVGEIMVDAENSAITPAHSDYGDTLTFIATGTF
jgi:hypothetical protein